MPVIGLLGGIGSGKSAVARLLAEAGAVILSGDALGHEALRQPDLKARIVERFGQGILADHGEVLRKKLGGIVFASSEEREALEAIVHPWITRRLRQELAVLRADTPVRLVVVAAAILIEAGTA